MTFSTYSDLKTTILNWMARPGDQVIPTADVIALFEADASRRLRTHFQEVFIDYTTVAGTASYDLPLTFLQPREVKLTTVNPTRILHYLAPGQLDDLWARHTNSQPLNYTIEGTKIRFGPVPNSVYTIRLGYWQGIPPLNDQSFGLASFVIANGSTGYTVDDVLILSGGTPNLVALLVVDTVDGDGTILTAHIQQVGDYLAIPSNPVSVTGGTGTGATITATFDDGGGETNWLLQSYPDIYLFGALAEAELFLGADTANARYQMFVQRREAAYSAIKLADQKYRVGGSPLVMQSDGDTP